MLSGKRTYDHEGGDTTPMCSEADGIVCARADDLKELAAYRAALPDLERARVLGEADRHGRVVVLPEEKNGFEACAKPLLAYMSAQPNPHQVSIVTPDRAWQCSIVEQVVSGLSYTDDACQGETARSRESQKT